MQTMVYTYVSRDHFDPSIPPIFATESQTECYVGAALHNRKAVDKLAETLIREEGFSATASSVNSITANSRSNKVLKRFGNQVNSKTMHICLETSVDADTLTNSNHIYK
jgi:hypothetical protein